MAFGVLELVAQWALRPTMYRLLGRNPKLAQNPRKHERMASDAIAKAVCSLHNIVQVGVLDAARCVSQRPATPCPCAHSQTHAGAAPTCSYPSRWWC